MPTRDRPTSRIGNSMTSPNTRNIVVTKSKYGPAAESVDEDVVGPKLNRNVDRRTAGRRRRCRRRATKKSSASGIHGRIVLPLGRASGPGATNAQSW